MGENLHVTYEDVEGWGRSSSSEGLPGSPFAVAPKMVSIVSGEASAGVEEADEENDRRREGEGERKELQSFVDINSLKIDIVSRKGCLIITTAEVTADTQPITCTEHRSNERNSEEIFQT